VVLSPQMNGTNSLRQNHEKQRYANWETLSPAPTQAIAQSAPILPA
jgi:hypothetical protein